MREHVTHFDDCGCKSAAYEAQLAALRERAEAAERERDEAQGRREGHPAMCCGQCRAEVDAALALVERYREAAKAAERGMRCWASDEDGIHPECVDAYEGLKAALALPAPAALADLKRRVAERVREACKAKCTANARPLRETLKDETFQEMPEAALKVEAAAETSEYLAGQIGALDLSALVEEA